MTALFFVDANVIVYARDPRDSVKQRRARQWLERLWRDRAGRTSIQVLSEYHVAVTRKLHPGLPVQEAWDDVRALFTWEPQALDEALLRRGREVQERYEMSWWDSLIVAAAELQGCSLLLSEDFQDGGVYGGVTVRSPFTLAVEEPLAAYEARSTARHPPRGRPRKSPATRSAA